MPIETIAQLVERKGSDLLKRKNFGRKSLEEVKGWLAKRGLRLKKERWEV